MNDRSNTQKTVGESIQEKLDLIYDDLSTKYDRIGLSSADDDPLAIVSNIIEDFWNISQSLVKQDFEYELHRQQKNKIGIPDIPTYRIRFAIEEGSWSVFFRDALEKIIKDEFNHLVVLEELIWETGAAKPEDIVYYLLELNQITETHVNPIFKIWRRHHDYSSIKYFAPLIIAGYHNTSIHRGQLMVDGAKRLVHSKLTRLSNVEDYDSSSTWGMEAYKTYELLHQIDSTGEHQEEKMLCLITIALLQRNILKNKKTGERSAVSEIEANSFNWKELDPRNFEEREKFSDWVIQKLYRRKEEDPMEAATNLLQDLLVQSDYDGEASDIVINFKKLINHDGSDFNQIVDRIQHHLPKFLLDLKHEEQKQSTEKNTLESIDSLDIWDLFFDNISRARRIQDPDRSRNIISKHVRSIYRILIDYRLTPPKIFGKIIEKLVLSDYIADDMIQDFKKEISEEIEKLSLKPSQTKVDDLIIIALSDYIVESIVMDSST